MTTTADYEPTTTSTEISDTYQASGCRILAVVAFLALVAIGLLAGQPNNLIGWNMVIVGIWAGAGTVCLVVGICLSMVCKQLESMRS